MPRHSWDSVPVFAHVGRQDGPFTEEEARFLARFPIVNLERFQERRMQTPAEKSMARAARQIKKYCNDTKVNVYWNTFLEDSLMRYDAYKEYAINGEIWRLKDKKGQVINIRQGGFFDIRQKDLQDWWVKQVLGLLDEPCYDGVFLDASTRPHWLIYNCGEAKAELISKCVIDLFQRVDAGTDKLMYYNNVNGAMVLWQDRGLRYLPYADGMMVEHFCGLSCREKDGTLKKNVLAQNIELIQKASRAGKIVLVRGWPKSHSLYPYPWYDSRMPDEKHQQNILENEIEFPLAAFLIAAGKNCYFNYSWGYGAMGPNKMGNFHWFKEYDRPLGPPKGDAKRNGWRYIREFKYASVWIDLEQDIGAIEWKK